MKNCAGQTLSPSQFNDIVNQTVPQNEICEKGGLSAPSLGSLCKSTFTSKANNCLKNYDQKFAWHKLDPALCQ